jgi:hypothetical protein
LLNNNFNGIKKHTIEVINVNAKLDLIYSNLRDILKHYEDDENLTPDKIKSRFHGTIDICIYHNNCLY